jgi:hypothetical protein
VIRVGHEKSWQGSDRMKAFLSLVLLASVAAACAGGGARSTDAAAAEAPPRDAPAAEAPRDGAAAEAAPQCCTVTLSGPGTESCPCNPNLDIPSSCHDVGRACAYQPCSIAVSCVCTAGEDGGGPSWQCGFFIP